MVPPGKYMCVPNGVYYSTARITIEKFWARSGRELGEKRARTFTNFDRGTVDFWHMGVQVSRINTKVYSERILEIFACFTVKCNILR